MSNSSQLSYKYFKKATKHRKAIVSWIYSILILVLYLNVNTPHSYAKISFSYFKDTDFFQGSNAVLNPIHGALAVESKFLDKLYHFPADGEEDLKTAQILLKLLFHKSHSGNLKPCGLNKPSYYFSPSFIGKLAGSILSPLSHESLSLALDKDYIEDSHTQALLLQSKRAFCMPDDLRRVQIEIFKNRTTLCSQDDLEPIEWSQLNSTFKKRVHKIYRLLQSNQSGSFLNLRILQGLLWHKSESKAAFASYLKGILSIKRIDKKALAHNNIGSLAWLNSSWLANELIHIRSEDHKRFCPSGFNKIAATFLQKFKRKVYFTPVGIAKEGDNVWMDCGENSIRNFFAILISRQTSEDTPAFSADKLIGLKNNLLIDYFIKNFSIEEADTCEARNEFSEICSGHEGVRYRSPSHRYEISSEGGSENILKVISAILVDKEMDELTSWHKLAERIVEVVPNFKILKEDIDQKSGYGSLVFSTSRGKYQWSFQEFHFEIEDMDSNVSDTLEVREWLGHHMLARFPHSVDAPENDIAYFDQIILASLSNSDSNAFYQNMGLGDRRNLLFLKSSTVAENLDILEGLQDKKLLCFWAKYVKKTSPESLDLAISAELHTADSSPDKLIVLCRFSIHLNLRAQNLGISSLIMLSKALKDNDSMISLNLSSNEMTDLGLVEIIAGIKSNTSLKFLNLSGNRITLKGLKLLRKLALHDQRFLENINLLGNPEIPEDASKDLLVLHRSSRPKPIDTLSDMISSNSTHLQRSKKIETHPR